MEYSISELPKYPRGTRKSEDLNFYSWKFTTVSLKSSFNQFYIHLQLSFTILHLHIFFWSNHTWNKSLQSWATWQITEIISRIIYLLVPRKVMTAVSTSTNLFFKYLSSTIDAVKSIMLHRYDIVWKEKKRVKNACLYII